MPTLSTIRETAPTAAPAPRAQFLSLALHTEHPAAPVARLQLTDLRAVTLGRGPAQHIDAESGPVWRIELPDARMSSRHALIDRIAGAWFAHDLGSKNGTFVNGARIRRRALRDGDVLELGGTFFVFRDRAAPPPDGERVRHVRPSSTPRVLVSLAPELDAVARALGLLAPGDRAVLIHGATGTGKELTARAVHDLSGRPGPFIAVNCAAIPDTLVEAALFGARRGAFSGATDDRPGFIAAADGGTLFLDEIAELSLPAQAALLRALQQREVTPVGATRPTPVDVRFVAATHRDLSSCITRGLFREDLYARIAAHTLRLPPLRARREDTGLIAACALLPAGAPALHRDAARALMRYPWPRNLRELDNALATAATLAAGAPIELHHLPEAVRPPVALAPHPAPAIDHRNPDALRATLLDLYRRHRGNISAVARDLGRARMQIQRWNKRLGIDPTEFR